jgi:hypothetical protein
MSSAAIPTRLLFPRGGLVRFIRPAVQLLKAFGPYAAIELLLPGGSLIALLVWLSRRRGKLAVVREGRCWPATEMALGPERMSEPATARGAM